LKILKLLLKYGTLKHAMNYPNTTDLSQVIRASPFWQDNGDGALNRNDSVFPVEGDAETDEWVGERTEQQQKSQDVWINKILMKPVRVLDELSSFANLSCLMQILATVAVTSSSAEPAMSRVKIKKKTGCAASCMTTGSLH
jgi:hypothetical protein